MLFRLSMKKNVYVFRALLFSIARSNTYSSTHTMLG